MAYYKPSTLNPLETLNRKPLFHQGPYIRFLEWSIVDFGPLETVSRQRGALWKTTIEWSRGRQFFRFAIGLKLRMKACLKGSGELLIRWYTGHSQASKI